MAWPLSQDYNEAIQGPRTSFADAELKQGEAVTNPLGIPMPRSGNFADVYEVRCPGGTRWAVKCFTRQVHDLRERYSEISKHLRQVQLPFMVEFQYLEQGIRVRGQWYPILKMHWVEGFVLNEFVRDNLDKRPRMHALGQIWLRMARRLREANIAHCDLQHGNVMLVPGSTAQSLAVKLIDYDGMCVPSLAGSQSGEVGHPAYQHPERLRTGAYHAEVDRFSLLGIATALRCLMVGGRSLWERYDNGDNLLFRQADLQAPAQSPLFKELLAIRDPQTQSLVQEFYRACQGGLDGVPLLTDLMPEEKPAGRVTMTATGKAALAGPDWDFDEGDEAAVVKRPSARTLRKRGVPGWVWGVGGAAAALLLVGAGLGITLLLRKGPNEDQLPAALAQNKVVPPVKKREGDPPQPKPKDRPPADPNPLRPGDGNPADPVKPLPQPVEGDAPVARILHSVPGMAGIVAVASKDGNTWRLVRPGKNEVIREFVGHQGPIRMLAFAADGNRAVTGSADKTLRVWDVQTGATIRVFRASAGEPVSAALSPDGRRLAYTDGGRNVHLQDLQTNKAYEIGLPRRAVSVAFAPDGRQFLYGFDGLTDKNVSDVIHVWDVNRDPIQQILNLRAHPAPVTCLALSPDGKYIAAGQSGQARAFRLWDVQSRKLLWQMPMPYTPVHQAAFSPDSQLVVGAARHQVRVWRVARGEQVSGFEPTGWEFAHGSITADGKEVRYLACKGDRVRTLSLALPGSAVVVNPPPRPRPGKRSNKPPVPDEPAVAEARRQIREELKDAYARESGKRELAKQLSDAAFRAFNNSARQYAGFSEAALVAASAGDLTAAMQAIEQMAFRWDVNVLDLKAEVLEQAGATARRPAQARTAARNALLLVERGLMTEQWDSAQRLLKAARTATAKADVKEVLNKAIEQDARKLAQLRADYEAVKQAAQTLETNPDEPEANRTLGTFRCAIAGNWLEGLPLLARCGDKALAAVAALDLADPGDAAGQMKVGDGWHDLAAKEADKKVKAGWQRRASQWYEDAYPQLPRAESAKVKARLQTLSQQLGLGKPWQHVDLGDVKAPRVPTGFLHLLPHHVIATRRWYGRPLEVTVVAALTPRPSKNHLRLTLGNGGELGVTLMDNTKLQCVFSYVARTDPEGRGIGPNTTTSFIKRGEPMRLRYLVKRDGVEMWINDSRIGGPFKTGWKVESPSPVRVWSDDSEVDIVSLAVRRIHEK